MTYAKAALNKPVLLNGLIDRVRPTHSAFVWLHATNSSDHRVQLVMLLLLEDVPLSTATSSLVL
jgi:hypothetical protein